MPEWYLCRSFSKKSSTTNRKIEGPWTTEKLEAEILSGGVALIDQVFDVGMSRWRTIGEIESFKKLLGRTAQQNVADADWVVYRPENKNDSQRGMEGPLTTKDVLSKMVSGSILSSHLIWRSGMEIWKKISEIPEFQHQNVFSIYPERSVTSIVLDQGDIPGSEELLRNVMKMVKKPVPSEKAPTDQLKGSVLEIPFLRDGDRPDDAAGEDLANPYQFLIWVLVFPLVSLLISESASAESRSPGTGAYSATRNIASSLEIVPLKLNSDKPVLVFQTNADPQESVQVQVKGRSGDVLKYPSFYRKFVVKRSKGEVPTLDLSSFPRGSYTIEAQFSGVTKNVEIFVGKKDAAFEQELKKHLKQISSTQQAEKKAFYYSAAQFEKLAKELESSYRRHHRNRAKWSAFYDQWRKKANLAEETVQGLASQPPNEMAFPEEVAYLKLAVQRLTQQANSLDESVRQSRGIASEAPSRFVRDLSKEFSRFKLKSIQLGRD